MKKLLLGGALALVAGTLLAQPPRPLPPDRQWKHDSSLLQRYLKIGDEKLRRLQPAFMDFYRRLDALLQEEEPRPPRFVDVQKLVKQRDATLLRELTKEEGEDLLRMEHLLVPAARNQAQEPANYRTLPPTTAPPGARPPGR